MSDNHMLLAAIAYALDGYKVFPCKPKDKVPLIAGGLNAASSDLKQISLWWEQWPTANIGLVTSQACTVLDVDKGKVSLQDYDHFMSLRLPTVITGSGGYHKYFKAKQDYRNKTNIRPGIDLRSTGGYVIAPPSIHSNGQPYAWLEGYLNDWDGSLASLSVEPQEVTELLSSSPSPKGVSVIGNKNQNYDKVIPVGGRNDYLTRVAGSMQRKGLSHEAILAALLAENETKLVDPLDDSEVERIAKSVSRYTPSDPLANSPEGEARDHSKLLVKTDSLASQSIAYLKDKDKVKGQPTLLDGLDKLLGGGKRLGEVTCWHAEAKTGKNTLWHYLMYLQLELGIPQAYASRELSPAEEVLPNLYSVAFQENSWLADMEEERSTRYLDKVKEWPLYFAEGYGYFPLEDIRAWIKAGVEAGISYFWFDHLHFMIEDPEDHKAASKLIKQIKTLAKENNVHIDIIIQPNKLSDGQKLSLNSIKGGAAMGQAIDNLLILERVKGASHINGQSDLSDSKANISKLTLEVSRSKLSRLGSIYLQYNQNDTTFAETEPLEEASPTAYNQDGNRNGNGYHPEEEGSLNMRGFRKQF